MSINDDEFQRVLSNPENVILSESLQGLIEDVNHDSQDSAARLKIGSLEIFCKIVKIRMKPDRFVFCLSVPSLEICDLLSNRDLMSLSFGKNMFHQIEHTDAVWKHNFLTITMRRIFNEAVQA